MSATEAEKQLAKYLMGVAPNDIGIELAVRDQSPIRVIRVLERDSRFRQLLGTVVSSLGDRLDGSLERRRRMALHAVLRRIELPERETPLPSLRDEADVQVSELMATR